eukprot:CAMPEP_0175603086 /NCGR_PEP_ID=MMETSP0096-20121207/58971_1 /TAXON_ID=311494 /ORGANISM="Alexandrium monilatum, Strain CCMP3105" /LENGTH=89 /DNA_ID=CAMNT_0016907779 /DNA_START=229 /DNA_END=495 /DNA_ORIENTATION=+
MKKRLQASLAPASSRAAAGLSMSIAKRTAGSASRQASTAPSPVQKHRSTPLCSSTQGVTHSCGSNSKALSTSCASQTRWRRKPRECWTL